jgi:hypothetical protein
MRKIVVLLMLVVLSAATLAGCGREVGGPRFWWDDKGKERLPEDYTLPEDPAAPAEIESDGDRRALPSGEDLTDENLSDYRTDLDKVEEQRKSNASLVDF